MALLENLTPEKWMLPTAAGSWLVRDVAAHLLDVILRRLSLHRDGHRAPGSPEPGYAGLVTFLNGLNSDWVRAAARLSPRVLTDLLEVPGRECAAFLAALPAHDAAIFPVAWAGESASENWMDVGREYTEWWHHQAQIRDAVGAPPLVEGDGCTRFSPSRCVLSPALSRASPVRRAARSSFASRARQAGPGRHFTTSPDGRSTKEPRILRRAA